MVFWPEFSQVQEYWVDACQRGILTLDLLRRRASTYREQAAKQAPHVLTFQVELIRDGRTLKRPVNYCLVRILPSADTPTDPARMPIIVVDPRAGHGPGIGGMKRDSEIGMALASGHPCYFIGFLPNPVPGQTVEDVCRAEAEFVEEVAALHPAAEGKPVVIANCQAGWQIMMMAAINPGRTGPIMLAGSPLSYWAGVRGKNPMRYLGGLLGGTWMTALSGDLGHGIFDGAHLIANFESLNPANTYWSKSYNVYSRIDTEADRFLDFETWWGNPVLLNAEEMQWIADNLFVGNKLSTGQLRTTDGVRIDLRNISVPIVVLCSWGDNITPPQQALSWILDLYRDERELIHAGQTIVYTLHQSIGHLGIFVSGKVATKEHAEFVSCMEMIEALPPGLYEAVITEVDEATDNPELIHGKYLFQLEVRTLDDLRALGGNDEADELRFRTAARVSEINTGLYRTFAASPTRAVVTEAMAEALRSIHPNRVRFRMFGDENPAMAPVKVLADHIREHRQPVGEDNVFLAMEHTVSEWIETSLQLWGETRDFLTETIFLNTYGSPLLQAMVGLAKPENTPTQHIERDLAREAAEAARAANLTQRMRAGGPDEAILRALVYIRVPERSIDERGFAALRQIRDSRPPDKRMGLGRFKEMLREQFLLVYHDADQAIEAIPDLLGADNAERKAALDLLHRLLVARRHMSEEGRRRLSRIEALFAGSPEKQKAEPAHV